MADESRALPANLDELEALQRSATESDFFQLLRRFEVLYRDRPRHGLAVRPEDEALRCTQRPRTAFAPNAVEALELADGAALPHRLRVAFLGMFGPNGPLPLPLTEYAERRSAAAHRFKREDAFVDLVDMFHHRAFGLLYRAWASSRPVVQHDRPEDDRFARYVGALAGEASQLGMRLTSEQARALHFAGLLASPVRNAEGLEALATELLGTRVEVEPLVGEWLEIPPEFAWKLGEPAPRNCRTLGLLGDSAVLGPQVYERQHKFRLIVGPVSRPLLSSLLPGGDKLSQLKEWVRSYVGDALRWDLRLVLADGVLGPCYLGDASCLGETTYLIVDSTDLIPHHLVDPFAS